MASRRLTCPLIMLVNVGALESMPGIRRVKGKGPIKLTLKVGHEGLCAAVQGVDDHFAVGRTGDLDASVLEPRGGRCTVP